MKVPFYQVDAFTNKRFSGNPAGVCPMAGWLPDALMQKIALENNLAETAFVVPEGNGYRVRWFTPTTEVDLCGHATLAAAHVLYEHLGYSDRVLELESRSGLLTVTRQDDWLQLDFPADELEEAEAPAGLLLAVGGQPASIWKGKTDYLMVFESQAEIEALDPDQRTLRNVEARGVIVTAPGANCDFVSRFFAPQSGVDEDPVTGSAHTSLTPYWASITGKTEFSARQLSPRGGELLCELDDDRVLLSGQAVTYLSGYLEVNNI